MNSPAFRVIRVRTEELAWLDPNEQSITDQEPKEAAGALTNLTSLPGNNLQGAKATIEIEVHHRGSFGEGNELVDTHQVQHPVGLASRSWHHGLLRVGACREGKEVLQEWLELATSTMEPRQDLRHQHPSSTASSSDTPAAESIEANRMHSPNTR